MIVEFKHTKVYRELCRSRQFRYVVNEGGTRSSKTWSGLTYFLTRMLSNPGGGKVFQIFRKTLTSCNRTIMRDFIEIIDTYNLWAYVKWNKSNSIFEINGNVLEFCGADQAQKLRGAKRWCVWLNEANEFTEEDFKQLKIRTEAQMFLDYNPSFTDHWIYKVLEIESGVESRDMLTLCSENGGVFEGGRVKLIQSTYKDNPLLSKEIIQDIEKLKLYNSDDYNVYALGIRSNPSGLMFKRAFYKHYDALPQNRIGVIYCDPNLSLKDQGDTTAIVKMYYSPKENKFYISDVVCHSFNNSNELLDTVLNLQSNDCKYIGFDGNFSQEATWTQHVENYSRIKSLPFPIVDYKRYRTDEISKTAQYLWNTEQILFNPNIEDSEDGKRFINQVFQFDGKKKTAAGNHDDAPDAMICAVEYIYNLGYVTNGLDSYIQGIFKKCM